MSEYEVTTMGAPAPVSAGLTDPVVVSVDGRLFALVVLAGAGAAVWWAWDRTKKRRT